MDRAARAAEQWQREKPQFDTGPMVLLGRLGEAALMIARDRLSPVFRQFSLQPGEFDVLATLRRSGAPYMLTPTDLYEVTMISSGSMTNRIDRLEKAGLVRRTENPADKRGTLVCLTSAGTELIDAALEAHVANQHAVVAGLTVDEQADLSRLLAKLISSLQDDVKAGR